jgi:tetratricopeptide (TPR) repeat protein
MLSLATYGGGFKTADSLVQAGNLLYTNHRYAEAESCFKEVVSLGYTSAPLFFNLGNAYYKQNEIAKAILYYEKARLLSPGDEDILQNLAMANTRIVDKIETIPVFFARRWVNALAGKFLPDMWAKVALVLFVLSLASFFAYVAGTSQTMKKAGFTAGIFLFVFSVCSLLLMNNRKKVIRESHGAIVMTPVVNVKSSPDDQGTTVFVLHEGTRLMEVDSLQNWKEVRIPDGNKGWVPDSVLADI